MYEVYALKYAERDTTACQFFYREASHAPITLHYYVWLILGGPHPVLVHTGFPEMLAAFETIETLAGAQRLIVAGHDPEVADRFTLLEPGIIKIA